MEEATVLADPEPEATTTLPAVELPAVPPAWLTRTTRIVRFVVAVNPAAAGLTVFSGDLEMIGIPLTLEAFPRREEGEDTNADQAAHAHKVGKPHDDDDLITRFRPHVAAFTRLPSAHLLSTPRTVPP